MLFWSVTGLVVIALVFDYINGFHDAANSIATVVSTRVLSPGKAVVWAAFFNFVAAFVFGTGVAQTIGKGTVDITIVTLAVICAALVPCVECPVRPHIDPPSTFWECPLCGGWRANKVTLRRKWTWRPQTSEDRLELPPEVRPKPPEERK